MANSISPIILQRQLLDSMTSQKYLRQTGTVESVNFYHKHPESELSLDEFEVLALKRVKVQPVVRADRFENRITGQLAWQ